MKVMRRTFEASKHSPGSVDRGRLNGDNLTSEYMTSYRYTVREDDGSKTPYCYRTKAEAERRANLGVQP